MIEAMDSPDIIWTATTLLTREHPDRNGFSPDEILRKICEIDPRAQRGLHVNSDGTYCLSQPNNRPNIDQDPILALRGLGRELWKELGGGEKFIPEMRENWYGREPTT
jgi:hypothetical protein